MKPYTKLRWIGLVAGGIAGCFAAVGQADCIKPTATLIAGKEPEPGKLFAGCDYRDDLKIEVTGGTSYQIDYITWELEGDAASSCDITSYNNDLNATIEVYPDDCEPGEVTVKVTIKFTSTDPDCTGWPEDTLTYEYEVICPDGTGGCNGGSCDPNGPPPLGSGQEDNDNGPLIKFPLGKHDEQQDSGMLMIRSETATTDLSKPSSLQLPYLRSKVSRIPTSGTIEQVKVPQGLVDVVDTSQTDDMYKLDFYYDDDVTFNSGTGRWEPLTGKTPFVTWTLENPNGNANQFEVTEDRNGTPGREFLYSYDTVSQKWSLTDQGQIRTTVSWKTVNSGITDKYVEIKSGSEVLSKSHKTYKEVNGHQVMTQLELGDGSTTEITTYAYYESGDAIGLPKRIDYPDGRWEMFEYDSWRMMTDHYEAYLDMAPPIGSSMPDEYTYKWTQFSYVPVASGDDGMSRASLPREVNVSIPVLNQSTWTWVEIERTYRWVPNFFQIEEQKCPDPASGSWGHANNLRTYQKFYSNPANPAEYGRLKEVLHADGTMSFYEYLSDSGGTTTIVKSGEPDGSGVSILNGTYRETQYDTEGRVTSEITKLISGGAAPSTVLSQKTYTYGGDPLLRDYEVVDLTGRTNSYTFNCCSLDNHTDQEGVVTDYDYDGLNRRVAETVIRGSASIQYTNILDAAGRVLVKKRIPSGGSAVTLSQYEYDVLGRLISETNALGGITSYSESVVSNKLKRTTTYPDTGTRVEDYHRDGRLEKVTGTAAAGVRYEYGGEQDGTGPWRAYVKEIKLDASGNDTGEWTKSYLDGLGRSYKTLYPGTGNPYEEQTYNSKGQLVKSRDPDGVITLYQYNDEGELEYTAVDINQDSLINFTGNDRINRTIADIGSYGGKDTFRTRNYFVNSSDTETWLSTTHASTDGLNTWLLRANEGGDHETTIVYGTGGARTETRTRRDNSQVVAEYSYGRLIYEIGKNSSGGQLWRTDYEYDAHGRRYRVIDARNGTTEYAFNSANQVTNVMSPSPHPGLPSQVTGTVHDNMGRVTETLHADGTVTYQEYYKTGLLKKTHGAKSYPVEYTYDEQGRMKTMKTWQDYSGSTGAATTEWLYDSNRGWLVKKEYQGETDSTDDYEYHSSGRLWKRHWERGITTVYTYNTAGDLWKVDYSDTVPNPDLTYTYQRRGLLGTVLKDGITTTYTYNNAGLERTQSYSGGVLAGLSTERTYYANTSLDGLKLQHVRAKDGAAILVDGEYSYDSGGRLSQVEDDLASSPPYTATYGYLANSKLVESVTFKEDTTTRLTTTRSYDNLNRLEKISSETSDSSLFPVSYSYRYNDANQRIRMTLADGSYWVYEYDALGQVKSAKRFWSSGELVAGQQLEYSHDDIGNRTETKVGGDTSGNNLRSTTYDADLLNQYDSRDNPGYVEVLGNAAVGTTVSINSSSSGITRRGEYFRKELSVANSTAQYESISVTTTSGGSESGSVFVPPATENYSHDTDGNLLSDGRWSYSWDQENRLVKMRSLSGSPAPERRIEFSYDHMGRRIRKVVFNDRDDGQGTELADTLFLYDGWNLLAELDNNSGQSAIRTYIWGLDLSGTLRGAGGVGGLLMMVDNSNGDTHNFYAYDGNGNVTALVDGTDGTWSARYEYGAFGEPIRSSGPLAEENPFRFSTKYIDNESGLAYYGYRYYNPQTGKWPNRDPINELGHRTLTGDQFIFLNLEEEMNLYGFVRNNPVNLYDADGRLVGYVIAGIASAIYACAKPQYNKAMRDFEDSGDNFKHCWVSCRISKTCGAAFAQLAGLGKEGRDAVKRLMKDMDGGTGDWIDSLEDLIANQQCIGWESYLGPGGGWLGALCRRSCEDCCKDKVGYHK